MQQLTEEITADDIDSLRLLVKEADEKVKRYKKLEAQAKQGCHEAERVIWERARIHWMKIFDERKEKFVNLLLKEESAWSAES